MGLEQSLTTVLGSTHVVEKLLFSMFPSTLAFDFDLHLIKGGGQSSYTIGESHFSP